MSTPKSGRPASTRSAVNSSSVRETAPARVSASVTAVLALRRDHQVIARQRRIVGSGDEAFRDIELRADGEVAQRVRVDLQRTRHNRRRTAANDAQLNKTGRNIDDARVLGKNQPIEIGASDCAAAAGTSAMM
jgi:hypothetical protein